MHIYFASFHFLFNIIFISLSFFKCSCFFESLNKTKHTIQSKMWNESSIRMKNNNLFFLMLFTMKSSEYSKVLVAWMGRKSFNETGEKFNGNRMTPCRWKHENKHTFDVCPMCRPPHDDHVYAHFCHNFPMFCCFFFGFVFVFVCREFLMVARGSVCYHRLMPFCPKK